MQPDNVTQPAAKIAIVTGGSRGLGRNTVHHLAQRGVRSIFTYHSNRAEADKVVAAANEAGSRAIALPLDTGKVEAFDSFIQEVTKALEEMGTDRFDFLVNNAGTSHHSPFEQVTEEELDSLYQVHFKGVFFLTQKLLPLLRDGGRIINVSSGLTRVSFPGSSAYASMKGGCGGADPLSGEGAGAASYRGQHRSARCRPDGLQRGDRSGQPSSEQDGLGYKPRLAGLVSRTTLVR